MVHLSGFILHTNYLTIKPLKAKSIFENSIQLKDLSFGRVEQAFDDFSKVLVKTQDHELLIIKEVSHFLMELKFSRFISCNQQLAEKIKAKKGPSNLTNDEEKEKETNDVKMSQKLSESFQLIKMLEKKLLIPLWLDGGTLLGWNRNCEPIGWDHDVDVATFLHYNERQWNLTTDIRDLVLDFKTKAAVSSWSLVEYYGFPWLAFQLRMWDYNAKWGVDIFFADQDTDEDQYLFGYHPYPNDRYCLLRYSKETFREICSTEFNGQKMFVPCKAHLVHESEYGSDWREPSKDYKINNGFCRDFWMPEEAPHAYRCLMPKWHPKLDVIEFKNYTREQRASVNHNQSFLKMAGEYFDLCQKMKMS